MKCIIAGILTLDAGTGAIAVERRAVLADAPIQPRPGMVVINQPLGPARLSQATAIQAAKDAWGNILAKGTNLTVQYGSWASGFAQQVAPGQVVDNPPHDVWAITVGGLNIPPHGPIGSTVTASDMRHFMTVFVDDVTGKVVMAKIY